VHIVLITRKSIALRKGLENSDPP